MKKENLFGVMLLLFFGSILFFIGRSVVWENKNRIEMWVDYEVKILDNDHVIFYKAHDVRDSLVFRLHSDIFLGTQAVEKLEYRLP